MSGSLQRLRGEDTIGWRTVVGLLLVPLTVAGGLIWGLWNPTDRLDRMTAAVVNLDEPVEIDGQLTPLGRVLAGELVGGGSTDEATDAGFTWVLTDAADAAAGLDDGRYVASVTIPKDFSAAATSFSRSAAEAERAGIELATSERGRLLDNALANIVVNTATNVLNETLGGSFVDGVFVGMTELGTGIGEAADGASSLADGITQLADGADALASGASELSGGAQQLSGGASELASGARQAAAGGSQLADGVESYTAGVNQVLSGLQAQGPQTVAGLQALRGIIANPATELPEGVDRAALLAQIDAMIAGMGDMGGQLGPVIEAGANLAAGARASANGQAQLANGIDRYAGGVGSFAAGVPSLVDGVAQLASGARDAASGAGELADGLDTAAGEIPATTEAQRQRLAESAVRPVEVRGASDALFTASGVPLFAGLALWAGALASFLVLAPLWRRARESARGVAEISLRSALPAAAIGAAQGALVGLLLPPLLGYGFGQFIGFFGLSLVAGVSFSLVLQGLSALFGGLGRFVGFAVLVAAFAAGVVSTAPTLLQTIGDASPVGALFAGFQAVAMEASGLGGAFGLLALWGLAGLALTAFAVGRVRRSAAAVG